MFLIAFGAVAEVFGGSDHFIGKTLDFPHEGYSIYIPAVLEHGKRVPLLIALPGKSVTTQDDIKSWSLFAEKEGFLVMDLSMDYELINGDADIHELNKRITGLIDNLTDKYNFDRNEIYVAGTSAGGVTSLALSLRYPKIYNVVGLVSGGIIYFKSDEYLKNANLIKFFIVHGSKDTSIPIDRVYVTKSELEKNNAQVTLKVIPDGEHALPQSAYNDVVHWFNSIYDSPQRRFARLLRNNLNIDISK